MARLIVKSPYYKCRGFLVGHVLCFRYNAFKERTPDDKAVAARSVFLFGQLLTQHLFPVLKLPDFLLSVLNLGLQLLAGFVMVSRSFPLIGIEKGPSIFSAAPLKNIKLMVCYLAVKMQVSYKKLN